MIRPSNFVLLISLLLPSFALAQAKPFDGPSVDFSHGDLRVSDNHRFLVHADGTPFFYLADTGWELFHRLTLPEAEKYLENRRAKGFTVIQAVALAEFDGLGFPNRQGHLPLADNDPTKPNEDYFKDVDAVVGIAEKKGIYIGLLPTWGDKVNKKWGKGPEIFNPTNARIYGEFLGKRYKDRPNIIWILGGDRDVANDAQRETWRAMAAGLQAGDGKRHLISFHPMGGRHSSKDWQNDDWLAFNMIQSGHALRNLANYKMIAEDYALTPTKPCMDAEPRYEDHPVRGKKDGYFDDYDTRQAAYWSVFAGSLGHTYGSHSIWSMHNPDAPPAPGVPAKEMLFTWDKAIDRPGGQAMTYLRRLMESRPFLSRVPDQSLIAAGQGEGADHVQATRGDGYAMLYLAAGKPITVHLNKIAGAQKIKAWWYNPKDGSSTEIGTFDASADKEFTPTSTETGRGHDVILVLDDAAKNWDAPGASYHAK